MSTLKINHITPYSGDTVYIDGILNSTTITDLSESLDARIVAATNEQDLSSFETIANVSALSESIAVTDSNTQTTITNLSTSVDSRLDLVEGGKYATTGSNTFIGNQTITGSLYVSQNLIIQGSSSIQNISSSTLNIGTNLVTVNVQNPSSRFGGLAVIDSGSNPQRSGSLLFDATENEWIYVHQSDTTTTSSLVIMGPRTFNAIGDEIHPTNNRIMKSIFDEHIGDSNISDNGTTISMLTNADVTGSLKVTTSISASTFTGVGNLTTFSASLDSRSITNVNSAAGAFASASAYSSSLNNRITSVSASLANTIASLPSLPTIDTISKISVSNPNNYTLYSFPTASYKGAQLTFAATEAGGENNSGRSTTYNILIAQGNNLVTNIQTYQIKSQSTSPAPTITTIISNGNVLIRVTESGTFNYTGYINLF